MNTYIAILNSPKAKQLKQALGEVAFLFGGGQPKDSQITFDFADLFTPAPDSKVTGGHVEAGQFDSDIAALDKDIEFRIAPDGSVWAKVADTVADLPDMGD